MNSGAYHQTGKRERMQVCFLLLFDVKGKLLKRLERQVFGWAVLMQTGVLHEVQLFFFFANLERFLFLIL